ncbi:MAG: hypothetical protein ACP5KG_09330, partial [Myxococcota bacterium]
MRGVNLCVLGLLVLFLTLSCSTTIDSTNPFDPEAPATLKMKGEIKGKISPEEPSDLENYQFTVSLKNTSYNAAVERDGLFVIKDIPSGIYSLRIFSSRNAYKDVEEGPYEIGIGSKLDIGIINIPLKKGRLRGFVTAQNRYSQKSVGVSGVNVFLLGGMSTRKEGIVMLTQGDSCNDDRVKKSFYSTTSSGDGSFYFQDVVVGTYRVNPVDSLLGIGYSSEVEVKENNETDVGEVRLAGPSAILHIEDPDITNQVINVTNKNTVRAVYMTGDFVNAVKLSLDGDVNTEEYKLIDQQAGSELITVPDVDGEHILRMRFRDIFCRESPVYETVFYYDSISPILKSLNIFDLNDGYINKSNVRIGVEVEDNYHNFIGDYSTLKMRYAIISSDEITGEITQEKLLAYLNNRVNYGIFSAEFTADITGGDGEKIFIVQFKDLSGNESEVYFKEFFYDTTAPLFNVEILNSVRIGQDDFVNNPFVNFVIKPKDINEIAYMKIFKESESEPANWEIFSESNTLILTREDGKKSFSVRLRDKAGNESELIKKELYLDSTPPVVMKIILNNGDEFINDENINIDLSVEGASEMMISEDSKFSNSNWEPYVSSKVFSIVKSEGAHTIYFKFRDSVGNIIGDTVPIYRSIILDKTPPDKPFDIYVNGKLFSATETIFTNSAAITLNWSMTDYSDVEKYFISIKKENTEILNLITSINQITIPSLSDGTYTAYIHAVDKAKNIGENSENILFEVDTVSPIMPGIVQPPFSKANLEEKYCNNNASYLEVSISVKADDKNIDRYELMGGMDINTCHPISDFIDASNYLILDNEGDPVKLKVYPIKDSTNNIQLRARDKAGNISNTAFIYFTEDSTPPDKVSSLMGMNADSSVLIRWNPPVYNNSDIAGYKIYYGFGSSMDQLNGDFSDRGDSPINAGLPCNMENNELICSFWLTGIPNNTPFYVNVSAYDNTQYPQPLEGAIYDNSVRLMSGELSPDEVKEITLNDIGAEPGSMFYGMDERDGILYFTTGNPSGFGGVYALDISHPNKPELIRSKNLKEFKDMFGIKVYGNYGFIPGGEAGVYIIRLSDFNVVSNVSFKKGERAVTLDIKDKYLFVGTNTEGVADGSHLYILDISNPENPQILYEYRSSLPGFGKISDIKVQGNILYLLDQSQYMITLDISNINSPSEVNLYDKNTIFLNGLNLLLSGKRMYLLNYGEREIRFLRYNSNSTKYEIIGSMALSGYGLDMDVNGHYIYVNTMNGVNIFKKQYGDIPLSSIYAIKLDNKYSYVTSPYLRKPMKSILARGNMLFVTYNGDNGSGIKIYNLSVPRSPKSLDSTGLSIGGGFDVALFKDYILFANYSYKFIMAELFANHTPEREYINTSNFFPEKIFNKEGIISAKGYDNSDDKSKIYIYKPSFNGITEELIYSTETNERIIDAAFSWPYLYIG